MAAKDLQLGSIRTDGGTQMRAELSRDLFMEYRDLWKAGADFPPIDVFHDGVTYWLADGFHRFYGAREAGLKTIPAKVHNGTVRDAILFAVGANQKNGARRNNADKRRSVETLLNDEEWSKWSDRVVAEKAGVSHQLVSNMRKEVSTVDTCSSDNQPKAIIRKGKDGKLQPATKPAKAKATPKQSPPLVRSTVESDQDADFTCDHDYDKEACRKCHEPNPDYKPKASEPAKPTFDDSQIINAIHSLSRLLAQRAKAIGGGDGFEACNEEIDDLLKAFTLWQAETKSHAA